MTTQTPSQTIEKLKERHPELAKFFLYFCIGISAAGVDVAIFFALNNIFDFAPEIATTISLVASVIYAFTLNTVYNFKIKTHLLKRFLSYFAVSLVGLVISIGMLWYFSRIGGHDPNLIKVLSLPIIFIVQFTLNRQITFRKA
jgi:putative flippase GtrA